MTRIEEVPQLTDHSALLGLGPVDQFQVVNSGKVALVAGLGSAQKAEGNRRDGQVHILVEIAPVVLVPIVIFWGLDGYFLWRERLFRALFEHVRQPQDSAIDFLMDDRSFRATRKRTWLVLRLPRPCSRSTAR